MLLLLLLVLPLLPLVRRRQLVMTIVVLVLDPYYASQLRYLNKLGMSAPPPKYLVYLGNDNSLVARRHKTR